MFIYVLRKCLNILRRNWCFRYPAKVSKYPQYVQKESKSHTHIYDFEPWSLAWYNLANPTFVIFVYLITPTFKWYVILGPKTPLKCPNIRPKRKTLQIHILISNSWNRVHVRDIILPILMLLFAYTPRPHHSYGMSYQDQKPRNSVQIYVINAEILKIKYPNVWFWTVIRCVI